MSTYTQILYQIVFCPKGRAAVLRKRDREELFKHISGTARNKKCFLYIGNGIEDHIHLVVDLHPTVALADLVKDIKLSTIQLIRQRKLFPGFPGWQEGYGAFTYSFRDRYQLIKYVENQEAHHQTEDFIKEYLRMLDEAEIDYDEQYVP